MLCPALLSFVLPSLNCPAPPALPCAVLPCLCCPSLPSVAYSGHIPVLPELPCPAMSRLALPYTASPALLCPACACPALPDLPPAQPSLPCAVLPCLMLPSLALPCPVLSCPVLCCPPCSPLPCPTLCMLPCLHCIYCTLYIWDPACSSSYHSAWCMGCKLPALDTLRTYGMIAPTLPVSVNTSMATTTSGLEWHQRRPPLEWA